LRPRILQREVQMPRGWARDVAQLALDKNKGEGVLQQAARQRVELAGAEDLPGDRVIHGRQDSRGGCVRPITPCRRALSCRGGTASQASWPQRRVACRCRAAERQAALTGSRL